MTTPHHRAAAINALPPLRTVIAQHNLTAQKSLGQNFLLDLNITDKIVRLAQEHCPKPWADIHAIEIGPGPGGLTRSMLKTDIKHVTAIEYDRRAVTALQDLHTALQDTFTILQQDALKTDLTSITPSPRIILANLPYNIATPLLTRWLKQIRQETQSFTAMTLMFQKEVAQRICAKPGNKFYGRLAVISQWLCHVEILYTLPPSSFTPPPKVESAIVQFIPKALQKGAPEFAAIENLTAAAFSQRRKMIRSSLKDHIPTLEKLGIDKTRRAETLSVQEFLDIAASGHQNQEST